MTAVTAAPIDRTSARPVSVPTDGARHVVVLTVLGACLLLAMLVAAGIGAYPVPVGEVVGSLLDRIGLAGVVPDQTGQAVLWQIRFPRVALAAVVGASLGCGGAVMQGMFRNPLAEPGLIGVSSGAAVGAVAAILFGLSQFGSGAVALAAFAGGLAVTAVVYAISRTGGRTDVVTLVLAGIAVNAVAGAAIGLAMFVSDDAELRSITFWNLGSVGTATWSSVAVVAPVAMVGVAWSLRHVRALDLLALGERPAAHLGVDVARLRRHLVVLVAVLASSAVAVAGVVTFVGLIVPHLVRLVAGPGHRTLVPGSALGGALLLVVGDAVARTVAAPAEIPLGVLTGLIGGPFFLWLLLRARRGVGGWA